jgi:hypothetical protein
VRGPYPIEHDKRTPLPAVMPIVQESLKKPGFSFSNSSRRAEHNDAG